MRKPRQNSDNRHRYELIKQTIYDRYPVGTKIPEKGLRLIMLELDIRAKDKRSQDTWLDMLSSHKIYGDAVIEETSHGIFMILPPMQAKIEESCLIAEVVRL